MGKVPVRLKEVVYTISPNQVQVMSGLWKDVPGKLHEKIAGSWLNAIFLLGPLAGTYWYCNSYKENEKLSHRY